MASRKIAVSRYDTADYLRTPEDIAEYLNAVREEAGDDPEFMLHALGVVARNRDMNQLARSAGVTRADFAKALVRGGNPNFALELAHKDVTLATELAREIGVRCALRVWLMPK